MCWYCEIRDKLKEIDFSDREAKKLRREMTDQESKRLLGLFAGPHGVALLKAYKIRKGLEP